MVQRLTLRGTILLYSLLLVAASTVVVFITLGAFTQFINGEVRENLKDSGRMILNTFPVHLLNDSNALQAYVRRIIHKTSLRITIILPNGKVVADSYTDSEYLDDHATRPEIQEALQGNVGTARRYSASIAKELMYIAYPVVENEALLCVFRISKPIEDLERSLVQTYVSIGFTFFIFFSVSLLFIIITSKRYTEPLKNIQNLVNNFTTGNLDQRISINKPNEVSALANALNLMAVQLKERMQTIVHQRMELEAILSGMVESVIVLDTTLLIKGINRSAAVLLQTTASEIHGKSLLEVFRNIEMQEFAEKIVKESKPQEQEISLAISHKTLIFQAHGTVLLSERGEKAGIILVMNEISHLKHLENLRKDFVANVSHELKTPITAIKGFVETLKDGALDDPAKARYFLGIIGKHTERMNAIIDDLLALSRLEQEGRASVEFEEHPAAAIIRDAIEVCETKALAKRISVTVNCDDTIHITCNPLLMEQALVNLIDNAIKYSEPKASITVSCEIMDDKVAISVKDFGCGIPAKNLPRIFERFYRVDRARSRDLGGTGLGLSIVKHIVNIHKGEVTVHSAEGQGSTFTILLAR